MPFWEARLKGGVVVTATIRELDENIYLIERPLGAAEPAVTAVLVVGEQRAVLLDTLSCPRDMAPVRNLLADRGRPVVIVNSHADWDHCWGNTAFPGVPLIGHRICRERLLSPLAGEELTQKQADEPGWFGEVRLVAPWLTFETALELDLGGLTLHLHHVPGHTPDCCLAVVPQRGLLLAGDCAEEPFPLVGDPALVAAWARELHRWAEEGVQRVVPAHGPPGGPALLRANAAYLEGLLAGRTEPPQPDLAPFYRAGHDENVRRMGAMPA